MATARELMVYEDAVRRHLAIRLREIRLENHLTQGALAERAGLPCNLISNLENNRLQQF